MSGIRIGLLSDTHGYIDEPIMKLLKECDEVWHAGDIGENEVYQQLQQFTNLRIVFGNIDSISIQKSILEDEIFYVEGFKVLMTHIAGNPPKFNKRVKDLLAKEKPNILVCGHSHILKFGWDKEQQLWFMNPGAAGKHGFHQMRTMLRFTLHNGKIENAEVIELGKRGVI